MLEVGLREQAPDASRADLATLAVRDLLDGAAELDLHAARQVEVVLVLEHVGDAPLPDWLLTRITAS